MFRQISNFLYNKKDLISNIKNAGLYFFGSIVQSLLSLIASPIYANYLSANEFGILGYFGAISNFLAPLFILSMPSAYLMRYFKNNETDNKKMLFNITFFLSCFNTILIFLSYLSIYFYFKYMQVNIPLNPYAWFILIALLLENIKHFVLINFRIRKKALSFFMFSSINSVLNFGIGILFVAYFNWGAEGRMLAPIISTIVMLPFAVFILLKYSTINFNFPVFLKAVKIVIPLVLAAYAYVPVANIDLFFLERLNNLSELGLYNIGITIAGYVLLAYVALGSAFEPDIFKSVSENDNKKLVKTGIMIFIPYFFIVIIFLSFSQNIISALTAGRYLDAEKYTNIALISVFVMGIYWFSDKVLIALEKTRLNLMVNIIGGIFSIIVMYFAVNNFQFIGAAYGKAVVALLMSTASIILVVKNLRQNK